MLASSFLLLSSGMTNLPASAQGTMGGNTSMMLLRVIKMNGQKYIETQTGETLPISGEHLAKDATAVAIYRDSGNNYWFIDKSGQPMSIPPQKVQWAINSVAQQRQAKEATAAGMPSATGYTNPAPSNTTIINNGTGSSGSNGMGMVGTGLAAAGGAMAGAAIGDAINDNNHYYGIPYGAPMYHDQYNHGYYNNAAGKPVYVNNSHNQNVMNQWNKQGNWDNHNAPANNPSANANNLAQSNNGQKESRRERRQQQHNGGSSLGGEHDGWGGFSGGKLDNGGGGRRFGRRR